MSYDDDRRKREREDEDRRRRQRLSDSSQQDPFSHISPANPASPIYADTSCSSSDTSSSSCDGGTW